MISCSRAPSTSCASSGSCSILGLVSSTHSFTSSNPSFHLLSLSLCCASSWPIVSSILTAKMLLLLYHHHHYHHHHRRRRRHRHRHRHRHHPHHHHYIALAQERFLHLSCLSVCLSVCFVCGGNYVCISFDIQNVSRQINSVYLF